MHFQRTFIFALNLLNFPFYQGTRQHGALMLEVKACQSRFIQGPVSPSCSGACWSLCPHAPPWMGASPVERGLKRDMISLSLWGKSRPFTPGHGDLRFSIPIKQYNNQLMPINRCQSVDDCFDRSKFLLWWHPLLLDKPPRGKSGHPLSLKNGKKVASSYKTGNFDGMNVDTQMGISIWETAI